MSNHHYHAVIWIDHHEARVLHFNATDVDQLVLQPGHPTKNVHHKSNTIGSGHDTLDNAFLHEVVESIVDAGAVLITGPANAKTELVNYIKNYVPKLMNIILGVETVDHPSNAQLVAYARKFFMSADRMQPQTPTLAAT